MLNQETLPGTDQPCELLRMPAKISAVYFLMLRGRVMYVGQTQNLLTRIWLHELYKAFDEVRFIRCAPEDLEAVERYWTEIFDPPWKCSTITNPRNPYCRLPPETISPGRGTTWPSAFDG